MLTEAPVITDPTVGELMRRYYAYVVPQPAFPPRAAQGFLEE